MFAKKKTAFNVNRALSLRTKPIISQVDEPIANAIYPINKICHATKNAPIIDVKVPIQDNIFILVIKIS